jgi:hypothetical protein
MGRFRDFMRKRHYDTTVIIFLNFYKNEIFLNPYLILYYNQQHNNMRMFRGTIFLADGAFHCVSELTRPHCIDCLSMNVVDSCDVPYFEDQHLDTQRRDLVEEDEYTLFYCYDCSPFEQEVEQPSNK